MSQPLPQIQGTQNKPPVNQPTYTGSVGELFGIFISNLFFRLLTLNIYTFWAKTKTRRYLWSQTRFLNEPFTYLGTGFELFKSYLKFAFIIILPVFVLGVIAGIVFHGKDHKTAQAFIQIPFFIGFAILLMYAKYSGLRYRLGRTSWRGIRFELRGSPWSYLGLRLKNLFLNVLTLGLYKPRADAAVVKYVVNNIYFGNQAFAYKGDIGELQKAWFLCWLLLIPTLGFSYIWYRAKYYAHVAKYTRLGNMEFRCKMTGGELLGLALTNILIAIFTVGLGFPLVTHRTMRFAVQHLKFRGDLDYDKINQANKSPGGEGAELHLGGDDFGL